MPADHRPGLRHPLILFLHGYGGTPTTMPFRQATGGKGYLVVGLSYGGQPDGGANGVRTDPEGVQAMIGFIDRVRAIVDGAYGVDPRRVILAGLSMGGWGVNSYGFNESLRGKRPYRGYCIIAAGGQVEKEDGLDFTVARGLPLLLVNGQADPNLEVARASRPLLEKAGIAVKQVVLPNQGHVPSLPSLLPPLRDWLRGIERDDERDRPLPAVRWAAGTLSGTPGAIRAPDRNAALAAHVAGQEFLRGAGEGKPALIFFTCRADGDGPPSAEAARSEAVEAQVFSYPRAEGAPSACRAFACFRVDVTEVSPGPSAPVSRKDAPLVLLLKRDHTLGAVFRAGRIREEAVLREMRDLLTPEERAGVDRHAACAKGRLRDLRSAMRKLRTRRAELARLRERGATPRRAEEAERGLADLEEELGRIRAALVGEERGAGGG